MQRTRLWFLAAVAAACLFSSLVLAACSPASSASSEPAPAGGGMGMASGPGEDGSMISGVIATAEEATLTLEGAAVTPRGVELARVVAPARCWVVVRSEDPPGAVLGFAAVPKGVSQRVLVPLTGADSARARVALHIDRGKRGEFEFEAERAELSLDRPVLADRTPVQLACELSSFGAEVEPNSVLMLVEDQGAGAGDLVVSYFIARGPSWISVHDLEGGLPARLLGVVGVAGGEFQQVKVPLDVAPQGRRVSVIAHADLGAPGSFEYEARDPLGSLDQPYRSAGVIVSSQITVK